MAFELTKTHAAAAALATTLMATPTNAATLDAYADGLLADGSTPWSFSLQSNNLAGTQATDTLSGFGELGEFTIQGVENATFTLDGRAYDVSGSVFELIAFDTLASDDIQLAFSLPDDVVPGYNEFSFSARYAPDTWSGDDLAFIIGAIDGETPSLLQSLFGDSAGGIEVARLDSLAFSSETNIPAVPLPGGLPLVAGSLAAFAMMRRKREAPALG